MVPSIDPFELLKDPFDLSADVSINLDELLEGFANIGDLEMPTADDAARIDIIRRIAIESKT